MTVCLSARVSYCLSHWYISADNYRWWAGDQLQVWEPPQALPSLAPPPLPCSVGHVWQRLLSLSLQLSSGVRQVTAGVPASPSMAHLFLEVWGVCMCVCVCFLGGVEGVLAVLALLTSRRSMLPAPSMSAHTPLPCRLDLTVGGDDGENLGSWRGVVDPKESERQRKTDRSPEAYLHPTGRSSDSPTLNGSLNLSLLGFFAREQKGCEMTADLLGSVWSLSHISVLLSLQASFLAQKL